MAKSEKKQPGAVRPAAPAKRDAGVSVRFLEGTGSQEELANDAPDQKRMLSKAGAPNPWFKLPIHDGLAIPWAKSWSEQTVEARWERSLALRRIAFVFFTFRKPEIQIPDLEDVTLSRWDQSTQRWAPMQATFGCDDSRRNYLAPFLECGYVSLVGCFAPVCLDRVRLRVGYLPSQCALHDVRLNPPPASGAPPSNLRIGRYVRDKREYDAFVAGAFPGLVKEIKQCPGEQTEALIRKRLRPFQGRALLGLKDDLVETGVDWNHTIIEQRFPVTPHADLKDYRPLTVSFLTGTPPRLMGADARQRVRRSLMNGWLPGVTTTCRDQDVEYRLTAFAHECAGYPGRTLTRIVCDVTNRTNRTQAASLTVVLAAIKRLWRRTWQPLELGCRRRRNRLIDANEALLMEIPAGGRFNAGLENVVRYRWRLRAGASRRCSFCVPRASLAQAAWPKGCFGPERRAQRDFRQYWRKISRPGARVVFPDHRLNALWKNLLVQCLVTAEGNRMPYGAFPSHYNGAVFGVEEGWTMQALAGGGYGDDALRYYENTYATEKHLDKKNYHHQYRAGLTLAYAYELFRTTNNRAWLQKHLERFRTQGADWIIHARHKTMRPFSGSRPLHWGLLPYHYYGGDVHKPAYSLYPNAVCWRGLRDFGLMLQALGRPGAEHYLHEAALYKRRINAVMEQTIQRHSAEAFLSMKLYWRKPYPFSRAFYPLFLSMFLETWALNPGGKDAGDVLKWLQNHALIMAGVPVLYPMRLDIVYGLGIAYAHLHAGRIGEYLKCIAGYRTFLMDPYFNTFPESGDICLRDEDCAWEIRSEDKPRNQWMSSSCPLTSAAAVLWLLLRHMLVMEERTPAGLANGRLLLLPAFPLAWYRQKCRVRVERLPTEYGEIGYEYVSRGETGPYQCRIDCVPDRGCHTIGVRVRPFGGCQRVTVRANGIRRRIQPDGNGTIWWPLDGRPLDLIITREKGV